MPIPRIHREKLAGILAENRAVIIEGPKACGKTVLARQFARSEVLLDVDESARQSVDIAPSQVLAGETPRLIDEWQVAPKIWNHIRRAVDDRGEVGQFILTGSSVPPDDITRHTGAGRISRMRLRPMSLFETGHSSGEIPLRDLLRGKFSGCADVKLKVRDVVQQLCRGGWPGNLEKSHSACLRAQKDYLREIQRTDIFRVDQMQRDPTKVGKVIRSLARSIATTVSLSTIAADAGDANRPLNRDTVKNYLDALERLMVYTEQPAWRPHLRSRAGLRSSPKRHFVDASLAVAALKATPEKLWKDTNTLGLLFESMVHAELVIYADACDADVYHYQDKYYDTKNQTGEVDAIVEGAQGDWCAFEIKLASSAEVVDAAARELLKFKDRVDAKKTGKPRMLAVITGDGYGYRRKDGVAVIPIGALGP